MKFAHMLQLMRIKYNHGNSYFSTGPAPSATCIRFFLDFSFLDMDNYRSTRTYSSQLDSSILERKGAVNTQSLISDKGL